MMAAEPSINNIADVSALPDLQPFHDAQDGDLESPLINGVPASLEDIANKRITSVEDQINSADVSVSGGSDTEASVKYRDGDKGHGRTSSSAKKPATFKAVSVNKTFLAAKSSLTGTAPKSSDKPAPGSGTPPTSSASLSISRPRLVAKTGSGARDSVPRFSSFANGGKPATAPDANAVWNKNRPTPAPEPKKLTDEELKKYGIHMASRLNEDDSQGQNKWADIDDDDDDWAPEAITWGDGTKTTLPHSDEPQPLPPPPEVPAASSTAAPRPPEKPASPAPNTPSTATPAHKSGGLPSGKGLILKSANQEKPTLVAKPPAPPAPAKSPWATLPPIQKTSPVPIEPAYPSRGPPKDPSQLKSTAGASQTKEIAADDFNRNTWRDRGTHGKELYNSRSGRYEPVTDRRGSMHSDSQTKHPSVLQRGAQMEQPADNLGPYPNNRSAQDGSFGRRRGSSNVSGGSGSYVQRFNKGNDGLAPQPPPEILAPRRTSTVASESPISPGVAPVTGHGPPRHGASGDWASRPSPGTKFAHPHSAAAMQSELNHSLPGQPLTDDIEYQKKLMREGIELARKRRQEEEAREEAARKERIQKKLEALGPPPERKSDVKDNVPKDGPTKLSQPPRNIPSETLQSPIQVADHPASNHDHLNNVPQPETTTETPSDSPIAATNQPHTGSRRLSQSQDAKSPNNWGGPGPRPDRFSSWAAGAPRNVWSSPDSDRGLGNGTFDPDLGRVSGAPTQPPQGNAAPTPIGPPPPSQPAAHTRGQTAVGVAPRVSRYGAPGAGLASKWVAAVAENDRKITAEKRAERLERERQLAEQGLTIDDVQPIIKDTWRPVQLPGDGSRHKGGAAEVQNHGQGWKPRGGEASPNPAAVEDGSAQTGVIGAGGNSVLPQQTPPGPPQSRPSRFFPPKDVRAEINAADELNRPASPSPPPPTMEGHPAYEGDVARPHVSLPKPQPVVKLPPTSAVQTLQPKANDAWGNKPSYRDTVRAPVNPSAVPRHTADTSGNWQDKINNLLSGGKPCASKSMGVDPASRNALDEFSNPAPTTVALPTITTRTRLDVSGVPTSKPMAEECFEEQEMGSVPRIRFPHKAPEALWQPAPPQNKPVPKKYWVQPTAAEAYYFSADVVGGGNAVRIHFPHMNEAKTVTVPFSTSRGGRGNHGRGTARHRGSNHNSRNGKRESNNNLGDSASSSSSGRGRGGYRGRNSETWNRYSQAQQPQQTSLSA